MTGPPQVYTPKRLSRILFRMMAKGNAPMVSTSPYMASGRLLMKSHGMGCHYPHQYLRNGKLGNRQGNQKAAIQ